MTADRIAPVLSEAGSPAGSNRRAGLVTSRSKWVALSAALAIGLAACGGGTEVIAAEDQPFVFEDSDFLPSAGASDAETPDTVPEALAFADPTDDTEDSDDTDRAESADAVVDNPIGADSPPSPPGVQGAHAVFRDGELFLRGSVQSNEIAELIVAATEEAVGAGNVYNEYTIDPDSDFDPDESQAIFLADAALFASDSAEVGEDFEDVLTFILSLINSQPDVTIWAFGHTDSAGDADANLRLSQERVDAVRDWIIERDGDSERFFAMGEGEANPIADNSTPEGRAQNRRVEFILDGFDIGI